MWSSPNENRKPTDSNEYDGAGGFGDDTELVGAERTLLCESIDSLLDKIHLRASLQLQGMASAEHSDLDAELFETGVATFDSLGVFEQLAIVRLIGLSVINELSLGSSQNSTWDAAIAVLIGCIRENLEIELDSIDFDDELDDTESWRQLICEAAIGYAAHSHWADEEEADVPSVSDIEIDRWSALIDQFANRWLPDHDFALADLFLDAPPNQSMVAKEQLGIENDYFIATIDEPANEDFDRLMAETRQLVRRKPR